MQVLASEPVIADAWSGGEICELSVFLLGFSPQKFLHNDSVAAHCSVLYVGCVADQVVRHCLQSQPRLVTLSSACLLGLSLSFQNQQLRR